MSAEVLAEPLGKLENDADKSEGELSDEGELSEEEGEVSDEGELPESEVEEVEKSPQAAKESSPADKFDRFKVWQEAMVNNMRSAFSKVGGPEDMNLSSSETSGSESEEENAAFVTNDSEIPPNLRCYDEGSKSNLLGVLGVTNEEGEGTEVKRKKKKKKKGVPSEWWERHKEIYEKMKERRLEMNAHRARTHCKFFQKGYCKEGDECPFLHEIRKKLDVCKYFMKNLPCHKGENCPYMHNEYPCKYFHLRGFCYNDKECRFSHEALTDDTKQIIDFLKNDRFDRTPRFKRERYRSRSRSPRSRSRSRSPTEKSLFTDPDAPPSKKVLLPTPEEEKNRENDRRDSDRHGRSPRYDRDRHDRHQGRDNYRGRGFFRGRGRGGRSFNRGGYNRGYDRGFRRGGFDRNTNNGPNSTNFNGGFTPGPPGVMGTNFMGNGPSHMQCDIPPPGNMVNLPLPCNMGDVPPPGLTVPLLTPHQQDNFIPLQVPQYERPPPPPPSQSVPPPPPLEFGADVSEPQTNGVFPDTKLNGASAAATLCPSRDPRLKQNSEKQKTSQPATLADMFKSLDPTSSPFG